MVASLNKWLKKGEPTTFEIIEEELQTEQTGDILKKKLIILLVLTLP